MRWGRIVPVSIIAMAGFASGCGPHAETKLAASQSVRKIPVTVAELARKPVDRTVEVVGTLKGWEEVTVGSKRAGRVSKILHDMGDRVAPGEPLVELDPVDARLAVQQAESRYLGELVKLGISQQQADDFVGKYGVSETILRGDQADRFIKAVPGVVQMQVARDKARTNLTRQRQLTSRDAGTLQDLQNVENDYQAAEAALDNAIVTARTVIASALASRVALDQAKQALTDMTIRAPTPSMLPKGMTQLSNVSYAVSKRSVGEGQMIKEGEAVAEVVIEDPLRLWTNVPERFSADVQLDQPVLLRVAARPGAPFEGKVARINPSVDPVSRTFQVEAAVPNKERLLRPGGFAQASILIQHSSDAIVVPTEAVYHYAGVTQLFVIENGRARAFSVETGLEGPGWVEVKGKDLPTKGVVATSGQTQLVEGTIVTIREPEKNESANLNGETTKKSGAGADKPFSDG